jgi:pyruvate/2-oxoglutarate dehydrogenase complex dihydrolipoamide acyltransferase (E2) component
MGRILMKKLKNASSFRKVAMGTWKDAKDPSIYGFIDIDMQEALKGISKYSTDHNVKITPTHLVAKAVVHCMKVRPEINALIRGSRIYIRKHINLFFQVNMPGEKGHEIDHSNLGGTRIEKAENLSLAEIASKLIEKAKIVKAREDEELNKQFDLMKMVPWWGVRYLLNLISWLNYGLNLNLSFLGIPKDPFGSVMITSVGSLGIDRALAPLVPFSRVPALLTVGAIQEKAVVIEGKIEIRPIMTIGVTLDHRVIDGIHGAKMAAEFKECFRNPSEYLFKN